MNIRLTLILAGISVMLRLSAQEITVAEPEKLGATINTSSEEVQPLLNADHSILYFVRTFYDQNIGGQQSGQDIWYSEKGPEGWREAVNLTTLNTPYNNAVVGVSADNHKLFLLNTYSNPLRWNYGVAISTLKANTWGRPQELPLKMEYEGPMHGYYVTPDESILLVSSASAQSYGQEDLFLYRLDSSGQWQQPYHFDQHINTSGAEISPFLSPDGTLLFFASDGHPGFGGFDLFVIERMDDSWARWSTPINLGSVINTSGFEGFLSIYENGETYFVSNKSGKSTDIYQTTLLVRLRSNALLSRSEALQAKFREVLLMDTTINFNITHVSAVTADLSQNFGKLLKGNASMNQGLFGVNERDSLINLNVLLQETITNSSDEFAGMRLNNSALSQDMQSIVTYNEKILDYIENVAPKVANRINDDRESVMRVAELKHAISGQIAKTAELKQEISNLVADNAFLKHAYTQMSENREPTADKITENNDLLEEKLHEWAVNLLELKENYAQLITATSDLNVYLTNVTDKKLSEETINQEFASALVMDTSMNHRILHLTAKLPELTQQVGALLAGNVRLDQRLFGVNVKDSLLNENVRKASGLDRKTAAYRETTSANEKLIEDMEALVNEDKTLNASGTTGSQPQGGSAHLLELERTLPEQMVRDVQLKQDISALILRNAHLKQQMMEASDGGEALLAQIEANNQLIHQEFNEWRTNMEAMNRNTVDLEIASSYLQLSERTQRALYQSELLNRQFEQALSKDDSVHQYLKPATDHAALAELISAGTAFNHQLLGITQNDRELNQNLALLDTLSEGSATFSQLLLANKGLTQNIAHLMAAHDSVSAEHSPFQDSPGRSNTSESQALHTLQNEMAMGLIGNETLKEKIAQLISQNADLKEQLIRSDNPDALADSLQSNNGELEKLMQEWLENLKTLQEKADQFKKLKSADQDSRQILTQSAQVLQEFNKTIGLDTSINTRIIQLTSEIHELMPLVSDLALGNDSLNQQLADVGKSAVRINQNLLASQDSGREKTSSDKTRSENQQALVAMKQAIDPVKISILPTMARKIADTTQLNTTSDQKFMSLKRDLSVWIAKNAVLKENIATLLLHNANLDEQLTAPAGVDTTSLLRQIQTNNTSILDLLKQWQMNMKALRESAYNSQDPEQTVELVETSKVNDDMEIEGYAVQVIAMPRGMLPESSFFNRLNHETIKMARGKDGLDRYYTGQYETQDEALRAMRKLRKTGYSDAFVRAIVKYSIL